MSETGLPPLPEDSPELNDLGRALMWEKHAMECRAAYDTLKRDRDAVRELLSVHNLGGMTDYNDGPMKRALAAEERERAAREELDALRHWLNNNTTFYDVAAGDDMPVLASVSKRIWYHATDNTTDYPFDAVIDAARSRQGADGRST